VSQQNHGKLAKSLLIRLCKSDIIVLPNRSWVSGLRRYFFEGLSSIEASRTMTGRVISISVPEAASAKDRLFELQVGQHRHDEAYHREIARLSIHQRLNHMALHFAKYVGKVATATTVRDSVPVFVDMLIIALSVANILNVRLWDLLATNNQEYPGLLSFGRSLAGTHASDIATIERVVLAAAKPVGRMAAACEKIDHLESVAFRTEIAASISGLAAIALAVIAAHGIEPAQAVDERLEGVKKRSVLHGRI